MNVVTQFSESIDLLYLDADGNKERGKGIYLEILETGYDQMPSGRVVLAHNSVNAVEQLSSTYRSFATRLILVLASTSSLTLKGWKSQ